MKLQQWPQDLVHTWLRWVLVCSASYLGLLFICPFFSRHHVNCFLSVTVYARFFSALDERGAWEQSRSFQGWGKGTDWAMSQSAVLPRCPFLQPSKNCSWSSWINIQETFYLIALNLCICRTQYVMLHYFCFALARDCHCDSRRGWDSWTAVIRNKLGNCPYGQVGYMMYYSVSVMTGFCNGRLKNTRTEV